mmetsp:Transcript_9769/g.23487  ORF Transcript_9769/g.23487 Transcript_9769/m.23487 type:complete len:243 (+) Transcript_9769:1834-2562(+)
MLVASDGRGGLVLWSTVQLVSTLWPMRGIGCATDVGGGSTGQSSPGRHTTVKRPRAWAGAAGQLYRRAHAGAGAVVRPHRTRARRSYARLVATAILVAAVTGLGRLAAEARVLAGKHVCAAARARPIAGADLAATATGWGTTAAATATTTKATAAATVATLLAAAAAVATAAAIATDRLGRLAAEAVVLAGEAVGAALAAVPVARAHVAAATAAITSALTAALTVALATALATAAATASAHS